MPELSVKEKDIKKIKHHCESQLTCHSWCCKCGCWNEGNAPVCAACGGADYDYAIVLYAVLS